MPNPIPFASFEDTHESLLMDQILQITNTLPRFNSSPPEKLQNLDRTVQSSFPTKFVRGKLAVQNFGGGKILADVGWFPLYFDVPGRY